MVKVWNVEVITRRKSVMKRKLEIFGRLVVWGLQHRDGGFLRVSTEMKPI